MSDAILARLTDVFIAVFDDDSLVLRRDLTAANIAGWDSLTHIRLMLSIERAFSIGLTALEIRELKSVGDLVDVIARKSA